MVKVTTHLLYWFMFQWGNGISFLHWNIFPDKTDSSNSQPIEWQGFSKRKAARLKIQSCCLFCHESLKINLSGENFVCVLKDLIFFFFLTSYSLEKVMPSSFCVKAMIFTSKNRRGASMFHVPEHCTVTKGFFSSTTSALMQRTQKTVWWAKTICHHI